MSFTRKTTVGGFLGKSRVFCHILSIGYEFETHDLAKLSEAADTLVNSDVTAFSLRDKLKSEDAVQADKHSYDIVDNELFYSEYMEEPDDASTPAGEKAVMLQVTNDIARTAFTQRLFKECSKDVEEDIDKNDLYSFRVTPRGNKNKKKSSVATKATAPIFPVEFTESLQTTTCSLWTGLELIVTFYNPKTGANIILETFLDACRRIFAHIGDLRPMPGELYLRDRKVGQAKRILYHKPNTNLYYMQTPDVDKAMSIGDVLFTPQMTFRAYAHHLVPIMLEILRAATFNSNEPEIRTRVKAQIQMEYDTLSTVNDCVQRLVVEYNKTQTTSPKHRVTMSTKYGQTVVCYLVLIMYKIHVYNSEYRRDIAKIIAEKERNEIDPEEDDGSGANYLKNYLTFASRHRNYDLYVRLVDVIHSGANKHGASVSKGDAANIVARIIDQPGVVYLFLFRRNKRALTIRLKPSHADFGNPSVSLRSYFEFMERARLVSSGNKGGRNTKLIEEEDAEEEEEEEMQQQDWFSSIDQYTNTFPIGDNDELMVENRMFAQEMSYFAKTVCHIPAMSSEMSVRHLRKMYDMLVVDRNPVRFSTENIGEKEYNPRTRRHVDKKRSNTLNKTRRV